MAARLRKLGLVLVLVLTSALELELELELFVVVVVVLVVATEEQEEVGLNPLVVVVGDDVHGRPWKRRKGEVGGDEAVEVGLVVAELRGLPWDVGEEEGREEVCRERELLIWRG